MSLSVDGFWKAGFWSETFWAQNFWYEPAVGILDVTEDDDVLTAAGFIIRDVAGILTAIEDNDISIAEGFVDIKFVVNALDLNLTIPLSSDDLLEQQRILIENFTLIQQALRNLGQ